MLCSYEPHFFWQNYEKLFYQIISHKQVQMISKKLHCSICFSSSFILFIYLFFDFEPKISTLPMFIYFHPFTFRPSFNIIFMLVPCSYLLRVSNTAYLNTKGILTYMTTKKLTTLKEKISNYMPIGVWNFKWKCLSSQNIN